MIDDRAIAQDEWPTWDWPERTNSYRLEAEGYAHLQTQVRFSSGSLLPPTPAAHHRFLAYAHRMGRMT